MILTIPDDIFQAAEISEADLKREIAIALYQQKKLSMGKARRLAGMDLIQFQKEIASRGICVNYDVEEFQADLQTLERLGDL
jgi:predicted HTH domain antitoxin